MLEITAFVSEVYVVYRYSLDAAMVHLCRSPQSPLVLQKGLGPVVEPNEHTQAFFTRCSVDEHGSEGPAGLRLIITACPAERQAENPAWKTHHRRVVGGDA
jgi:hypothetical protein